MRKLRINTRLLLGFGITILLMLAIAATGIWRMADTKRTSALVQERQQLAHLVNELAGQVEVNANQVLALSRLTANRDLEFFEEKLTQNEQQVADLYEQLEAVIPAGEATAILDSATAMRDDYIEKRQQAVNDVELGHLVEADIFFSDEMPVMLDAYIAELRRLAQLQETGVASLIDESNAGIQLG
ncbi:MAG TPA: MCP four helix bundle domain-containing protein, partial [Burkholderiaceae bacterium]|nr:MCP four helix bundle domain-containing protein [Burkholderiaceae bacterium]